MNRPNKRYEAPQAEAIVIETQSVLCSSGGSVMTNADGGTEIMSMEQINWP